MFKISQHSKERLVERVDCVTNVSTAKRLAKQAWMSGKTIDSFSQYPEFANYLRQKRNYTNTGSIRVYKDNIYIWRGKKRTLVTVHSIPEPFKKELKERNICQH